MGTSLTGLTPSTTYDALIKVGDNGPITSTLKTLSDGLGNDLPMEASTTTINFTNGLQQSGVAVPTASQVNAKQDTLVSGTNIKTINGTSVLGSGNIVTPTTNPSGVAGAIQFSNGSAFASDASNFFWDDTNNRLGVGTNVPSAKVYIQGTDSATAGSHLIIKGTGTAGFAFADYSGTNTYSAIYPSGVSPASRSFTNYIINSSASGNDTAFNSTSALNLQIGGVNKLGASSNGINIIDRLTVNSSSVDTSARAVIKGSGSTIATTSLLVQNSSGLIGLIVTDDGSVTSYGKGGQITNAAFGGISLAANTSGSTNAGFGYASLNFNTTGSSNTAIGFQSGYGNATGSNNTAIGRNSNITVANYSDNTTVGAFADCGGFSGCTILGKSAVATANNQFVVGSTTTNAGAIDSSAFTQDKRWKVKINGVDYYIALQTA